MTKERKEETELEEFPKKEDEGTKEKGKRRTRVLRTMGYWLHEALLQIRFHKASYALGFLACLMVVVVVAVLLSIIGNAPVVYLRIAEMQESEMDVRVRAMSPLELQFVNYTQVARALARGDNAERFSYHSLRWEMYDQLVYRCSEDVYTQFGNSTAWAFIGNTTNTSNPETRDPCVDDGSCFAKYCRATAETATTVMASDTAKDKRILLGRAWDLPAPVGVGAAHISAELAQKLGVGVGDHVHVVVEPTSSFGVLWRRMHATEFQLPSPNESQHYTVVHGSWEHHGIVLPLTVAGVYSDGGGRVSSDLSTGIVFEYDTLGELLARALAPDDTAGRAFLARANMSEYARTVVVNMPPPRTAVYLHSDMDTVRKLVMEFACEVTYRVGYPDLDVYPVVMSTLDPFAYVSIFLGLIINMSVFVLMLLCVVLIYSLLMINVESRTFEMGVLRMIGSRRAGLVGLLVTQALTYALPAIVLGLPLAQLLGLGVFRVISVIASIDFPNLLTWDAVVVAAVLGIVIPLLSAILPIRNALMLNLSDSIDGNRSKTKAVVVEINRSEQHSVSVPVLVVGLFLALFGIGIYLVFPAALMAFNISLILNLLFVLLLLILFGCVMLSLTLEGLFSRAIATVFFFWERKAIRSLLSKNLVAHRLRNRKTIMMYSLSLAFIIFLSVSFSQQISSMQTTSEQSYGAPLGIEISGSGRDGRPYTIDVVDDIERVLRASPLVADYAYATVDLTLVTGSQYTVSNIGRIAERTVHVYGVSPNYFDLAYPGYLSLAGRIINASLPNNITLGEQLYTDQGSQGFIMGSSLRKALGIDLGDHFLFNEVLNSGSASTFGAQIEGMMSSFMGGGSGGVSAKAGDPPPIRKNCFAFVNSVAGLTMSKYSSVSEQDVVVSLPHYVSLSRGAVAGMHSVPIARVFIKLVDARQYSDQDLRVLKQDLKDVCATQSRGTPSVWDVNLMAAGMSLAERIIQYFFILTTVIAMVTSFFSLSSSMLANVLEQTKEIAILRALGMTKPWLYRIYVYEAFVVVFGSSVMGILVGTLLSWAFTINQRLFTELPLPFVFPWQITLLVFGLSVVFAFLASISPIHRVMNRRIINIMRLVK